MDPLVFVKLGGSLITDKTRPFIAKKKVIKNLAKQIKASLEKKPMPHLILGNGAGSFGHYPAKLYNMKEGIQNDKQKMGFCVVGDAVARLNRIVVSELISQGVAAATVSPSSIITSRNGKIKSFFLDSILLLLKQSIVPVLYGDIVADEVLGSHIFSTEEQFSELAIRLEKRKIRVQKVIECSSTEGVLDAKGNLIPKITADNFKKLSVIFKKTEGYDVTGGMLHKVEESLHLASYGIKSFIISGEIDNLLTKAILGKKVRGTVIE